MSEVEISQTQLEKLWRRTSGKGWEPASGTQNPLIQSAVKKGYLRIVDGRCGFERFKDSHVVWTEAARTALEKGNPQS